MESNTSQWVFSQEIPSDVVVEIGETRFPLHKSILVAKSGYIRKKMLLLIEGDLPAAGRIDLSLIPGGAEMFEKAARFCYGINFEINIHNVAALHCAAEYLEMTEFYCQANLVERTEGFLSQVALKSPSGTLIVLMSCNKHLQIHPPPPPPPPPPPQTHPIVEEETAAAAATHHHHHHYYYLNLLLQRCVDVASSKACNEANFPSPSPANWWIEELTILDVYSFKKIINSMKYRGAKAHTLSIALKTYTENSLGGLVRDHHHHHHHRSGGKGSYIIGTGTKLRSSDSSHYDYDAAAAAAATKQRNILETIVSLLPPEKGVFPLDFLCYLLRSAIFLEAGVSCKNELENKISAMLEHVNVDDLLVLSFTLDGGEKLFDLESVRRVISGFVDKEKSLEVFSGSSTTGGGGGFKEALPSMAMQKVASMVDAYLGEIATYTELSISKFNGIANLVPKAARKVDDHLYRSIDIYLKAHPGLDEIEREKVCSVMDPFKLSYEARVHASQNKRLPVQIVLHALYYDQLKLRSAGGGGGDVNTIVEEENNAGTFNTRTQLQADVSLVKENEELRTELMKMKLHISYLQKNLQHHQLQGDRGTTSSSSSFSSSTSNRPINLFYSVSKKLGKLKNSFRHGSKDTLNMGDDDDDAVDVTTTMPRRGRRFSIS